MNRSPDNSRDGIDVRRRPATEELRPRVDETQSSRQEATAAQPRLNATDLDEELSAAEIDETWARWCAALSAADEDFDMAVAYRRLAAALPADLVAIPLVERAALRRPRASAAEKRSLTWGLVAMLAVCAGLGALAFYGPGWERRRDGLKDRDAVASSSVDQERPTRVSVSPDQTWEDVAWDSRLDSLVSEFDAELRRIAYRGEGEYSRRAAFPPVEREFDRAIRDFDRQPGF